ATRARFIEHVIFVTTCTPRPLCAFKTLFLIALAACAARLILTVSPTCAGIVLAMPACAAGSLVVFGAPRRAHTRLRLIEILAASSRRVVVAIVAMPSRSPRIVIVLEARRAPGAILIACADPPRTLLIVFRFARRGLIVAEIALFTT